MVNSKMGLFGDSLAAIALIDEIHKQNSTISALRLAIALQQYRRPRGRPKKIAASLPNKVSSRPLPLADSSLVRFVYNSIPMVRAHHEYRTWRKKEALRKDSRDAATLFILEVIFHERGKSKHAARRALKTMSNYLSKHEKIIPKK